MWRYHLAPRLQGLGRTPDGESDLLAPLTARLLVEADAQQLQLELVDFRRLRRRHRRQEPTRRVQGAVRVVAGEEFLMRPAVAVASHLTDEAALGRPEDRPEYLVPRLPHQLEERRDVPLRDTAVANLRIVDERPQRSRADLLRLDRALRLAVDERAEPRLQQLQRLADPFVVGCRHALRFPVLGPWPPLCIVFVRSRRELAGDGIDTGQKDPETGRPIAFARQMLRHPPGAGYLLELRNVSLKHLVRAHHGVGVAESCSSSQVPQRLATESLRKCVRFTEIPRFQFLARKADQSVGPTSRFAEPAQGFFPCTAVPSVVVPDNREPYTGLVPRAELARDAAFQIGLSLVGYAQERQARKQTRQQSVEELLHRLFLQQKDQSHRGSAPSKRPCFQSAPGGSPSAFRLRNSSLSDARRTVANPSFFTSQ